MAKLKICGLKRVEDIDYVNELKVDYIGFILSDGYKRSIDFETAQSLKNRLSKDIKAVGVFVDEDKKYIDYYIKNNIIDIVQLHGNEEPEFCKGFDVPVIKCFNPDTFSKVDEYDTDYFLFDSGAGTGKEFDWNILPECEKPFFLAGGISIDNAEDAVNSAHPFALDVSSSLETNSKKDRAKVEAFVKKIRGL